MATLNPQFSHTFGVDWAFSIVPYLKSMHIVNPKCAKLFRAIVVSRGEENHSSLC